MSGANCVTNIASTDSFSDASSAVATEDETSSKTSELNGDMKHVSQCDFLPNNNLCDNVVSSMCTSEENCAGDGLRGDEKDFSSGSTVGETSSEIALSCEGDSRSLNTSDDDSQENSTNHPQANSETSSSTPVSDNQTNNVDSPDKTDHLDANPEYNNGAIKKTNHRVSKSKKKLDSGPGRGRPRKALVQMYHSQISGDKNAIKIRIKKSNFSAVQVPLKKKSGRRRRHKVASESDNSDYEITRKRVRVFAGGDNDVSSTQDQDTAQQSPWGTTIPEVVLFKIFQEAAHDGALPVLVKLSKVCKLWQKIALLPALWVKVDLNSVKEHARTELRLHWLIQNRLRSCQDLNLGEWKIRNIQPALEALCESCADLRGLNVSGWQGLNSDNIKYIAAECKKLERLDLSYINSTAALNAQLFVSLGQTMNNRLTHLVLAHNKMASFTQILASIATHCPNLQLLDISNIKTFAHNTALLHVEKLQMGCQKLRILRITNSQIWLAPASLTDQMASPGFPLLEELSLAGVEDDKTTTSRSADDDAIERILKNSTKLRLLDIRGCIRLTDSGLVRVPAWDLEHLFLSGCYITRTHTAGLELIVQKWSHSLLEVDLAWSTATEPLDAAVKALAEKGAESKLRILNLCGSSVSLEPVKAVLSNCTKLHSINLQSCRALPRGIKRLYTGSAVGELRQSLQDKPKTETVESESEQSPVHSVSASVQE